MVDECGKWPVNSVNEGNKGNKTGKGPINGR